MSDTIEKLVKTIKSRKENDVKSSYTSFLLSEGSDHCLNKLKEELGEFEDAIKNNKNLVKESSEKFGSQCIVVAVDAKKVSENKWEIFTHGGRKSTGIDALKFVEKMESLGAGEILLTSMDRDGTKKGYDLDLTKKVSKLVNIPVIASGGVGNLEHLHQGIKIGKASAVLAASIFHFGKHTILEAKQYLDSKGIPVRI